MSVFLLPSYVFCPESSDGFLATQLSSDLQANERFYAYRKAVRSRGGQVLSGKPLRQGRPSCVNAGHSTGREGRAKLSLSR